MAKIPGLNITAPVVPSQDTDTYPSHRAIYGYGGWREVSTIADRDAIPSLRRESGMSVYVTSEQKLYILQDDLVTWNEFKSGSTDSIRKTTTFVDYEPLYAGEIVQYIGPTNANYTNGYFYKQTGRNTTYTNIQFTPLGEYEIDVNISNEDLNTFLNEIVRQTDYPVASGRFGYYQTTPNVLWYLSGTSGHRSDGFTYSNTPEGYSELGFTVDPAIGPQQGLDYTVENTTTWVWTQYDVQPDTDISGKVDHYVTMPANDDLGKIVQYIGATDSIYTNGYFYKFEKEYEYDAEQSSYVDDVQVEIVDKSKIETFVNTYSTEQTPFADVVIEFTESATSGVINGSATVGEAGFETFSSLSDLENKLGVKIIPSDNYPTLSTSIYIAEERVWNRVDTQPETEIIDNTLSTSSSAALSANMGRDLQEQIDGLTGRGRYLTLWNCVTGLADTNPPESPYTYRSGDYFIVGEIGNPESLTATTTAELGVSIDYDTFIANIQPSANVQYELIYNTISSSWEVDSTPVNIEVFGLTILGTPENGDTINIDYIKERKNYRPTGSQYVIGVASTVEETEEVNLDDTYIYDGTTWHLQYNTQKTVTFHSIVGSPYDNIELSDALNSKQDNLTAGTDIDITNNVVSFTNESGYALQSYVDAQDLLKQDAFSAGIDLEFDDRRVLPSGYTQLEYLESTGTQYIDTGVLPSNNIKIRAKTYCVDLTVGGPVMGSRTDANSNNISFAFVARTGGTVRILDYFNNGSYTDYRLEYEQQNNQDFVIESSKYARTVYDSDGITVLGQNSTLCSDSFTATSNIWLFGVANQGNYTGRIYSAQIYDNSTLVRNFIPARNNSTGVAGMYDTVNNVFYTNVGSGDFVEGPIVALPKEYQEVEYIIFSGTQYINTEVRFSGTSSELEAVASWNGPATAGANSYYSLAATQKDSNTRWGSMQFGNTAQAASPYYICAVGSTPATYGMALSFDWVEGSKSTIKVVTNTSTSTVTTTYNGQTDSVSFGGSCATDVDLYIGCKNTNGNRTEFFEGKLYSFSVKLGNTVVRRYKPCIRRFDGVAGLYDFVTGQFYQNSGTGTFDIGPAVYNDLVLNFTNESGYAKKTYVDAQDATKQDKLTAGANIQIDPDTNEISATDTTYTAGTDIEITNANVINFTNASGYAKIAFRVWGANE